MAVIYYPSSASVYTRYVASNLIEQTIGLTPNTIFVFTSSIGFTSSFQVSSASYSTTSSYALNGGGGSSGSDGSNKRAAL